MRVVVSGGGTGGHIFPALAVAESLSRLRPDAELLFIGGTTGMETRIVPERGVPFRAVTARKLRKVISPSTLLVGLSLFKGFLEARSALKQFGAEAVVGTGGYVAAAAVLAGANLRLPTVIVAPDVVPGRTNSLLARRARRICVMFEQTVSRFPSGKTVVTGMPLRAGVVLPPPITPGDARLRFAGLTSTPFTIVVMGGSQGAQALNEQVLGAAPALLAAGVQILHQTGARNIDAVLESANALIARGGYCPIGFLDDEQVPAALRAADLVVCRGGISTLSENLVNGRAAVVVPLPTAYADHQTVNARALVSAGAAALLPQSELTRERITTEILGLRADEVRRLKMAAASQAMGRPDAADSVAREVIQLLNAQ